MPTFQRNSQNALTNAAFGYQGFIQGTASPAPNPLTQQYLNGNTRLLDIALAATTQYYFFLPTAGASAVTIILGMTNGTAMPTIAAYPVAADGVTKKTGSVSTPITLTTATPLATAIAGLQGEAGIILSILTGAGATTVQLAEYTAL